MGQPRPLLSFIFGLFKQTSLQFLQQIYVKKCPSSIQCQDSNPQPSEHEPPPITTRPGFPQMLCLFLRLPSVLSFLLGDRIKAQMVTLGQTPQLSKAHRSPIICSLSVQHKHPHKHPHPLSLFPSNSHSIGPLLV